MRPSAVLAYHSTAALTLALATSVVIAAAPTTPQANARREAGRSPVRCNSDDRARVAYEIAPPPIVAHAPPVPTIAPPPPPPPPAPMVALEMASPASNIVVTATRAPYGAPDNTERYKGHAVAAVQDVAASPVSTFSVDVDTGAYANARRFLRQGQPVPPEAVRTEEFINYFRYDYPRPADRTEPFSVTTDVALTPWNPDTRLMRIGLRGYDVTGDTRPAANLVFLVDVSGSMDQPDKLPLVKTSLEGLADRLTPRDRVSIVVYAGAAGLVLEPSSSKEYVKAAISCLQAGGSTAGAQGIELAYATARANYLPGGVNRIFLATDGDFNVGVSDDRSLEELVKRNRDDGITLTTLGYGQGNYNEAMMERIADVGNGNYSYIDSASEARKVLDEELSATMVTIAKDVKVQVEFNPAHVSQYRLIGYENRALREEDFANDAVDAGDIGAGHQVTALYEVVPAGGRGWTAPRRYEANRPQPAAAAGGPELAHVKLRYKLPEGRASREIARPVPAALLRSARAPAGDMAFATAVAAFGQRLRGDPMLGGYGYADIRRLAGFGGTFHRAEFAELTALADRDRRGAVGGSE
jgi:Ca-activated chloride channel family protein